MDLNTTLDQVVEADFTTFGSLGKAKPIGGVSKRGLDISIAMTALLILAPLMLVVAFLVWWHDRGHPFFGHTRVGCGGRPFKCLKFRSMVKNAGTVLDEVLERDPEAAREWAETQKLRDDPRVTPIGRLLRITSLDELPQLFNVLSGHMSIVGPRPIVISEIDRYGQHYHHYSACRPGVTGLWQVSGRSDVDYDKRVNFDVTYASSWTLWRDAHIIVKTVPIVLNRKGSY